MKTSVQKLELAFVWQKPSVGYVWEDCQACDAWGETFEHLSENELLYQDIPEGPFLTEADYKQSMIPWEPFGNAALFARFADIEPNAESFMKWANGHGRLIDVDSDIHSNVFILSKNAIVKKGDLYQGSGDMPLHAKDNQLYRRVRPDSLNFWLREYRELSFAVVLWEMAVNKDARLNGIIEWAHEGQRMYVHKFRKEALKNIDFDRFRADESYLLEHTVGRDILFDVRDPHLAWMSHHCRYPDVTKAASIYLQLRVNRKIREYPINITFHMDDKGILHKRLEPGSLLSAMWYQLYFALNGEIRLRRCSLCGTWESMEGHRENWSKHASCANNERVRRSREKSARP
ncbi:hypothetical protein FACS1894216_05090 [Synergistales bacterium]|nr:hypothetical protein FACS1894216_05090 [Synergistales bacterium]